MSFQTTAQSPSSLADVLSGYLRAHIYSYSQLAKRSGVPERTIVNWLDGSVRRPRRWQGLVRLAHALDLTAAQTDTLLDAAGLPLLRVLRAASCDPADLALLVHWPPGAQDPTPVHIDREQALLESYCRQVIAANLALNEDFPSPAPFTFEEIFQDPDVRLLHGLPKQGGYAFPGPLDSPVDLWTADVMSWSAVRERLHRAVIVGKSGSGKRWLLRYEAVRLARAALAASEPVARIPFVITLADLAPHLTVPVMPDQLLRAIALRCATHAVGWPEPDLVAALLRILVEQPARAVFLVDGDHGMAQHPALLGPARRALELLANSTRGTVFATLRPLGYAGPPFVLGNSPHEVELELLPLRESAIARIVRGWFYKHPWRGAALLTALRRSPALTSQASNPNLLQLYCRLVGELETDDLPDGRELQNRALAWMLRRGEAASHMAATGLARWQLKQRLLQRLAWQLATYRGRWQWDLSGEVLETLLDHLPEAQTLLSAYPAPQNGCHPGVLWELSEQDGLLVKGEVPRDGLLSAIPYAFLDRALHTHLVVQYLIDRYTVAGVAAPEFAEVAARGFYHSDWRAVVAALVDYAVTGPQPQVLPLRRWLCNHLCDGLGDANSPDAAALLAQPHRAVWQAQLALASGGSARERAGDVDALRRQLVTTLQAAQVPTDARVAAGRLLNEVGDPRAEVMDVDAMPFVAIPAGTHLQGSDPARDPWARPNELPAHSLWLPGYHISRYPVSQAQFAQFLADTPDPYTVADYWPEAVAAGYWRPGAVFRPTRCYGATGLLYPVEGWHRTPEDLGWPYHLPNHPVCGIGWYEARAFARWLTRRWHAAGRLNSAEEVDLPDEAEWEKAARGPGGWVYPWGDHFDSERLAWEGLLLMAAPPIGAFPHGASAYGVEEMSGHLWQWTSSVYGPYPLSGDTHRALPERLRPADQFVIRGGGHFKPAVECRATLRWRRAPAKPLLATFHLVIRPYA